GAAARRLGRKRRGGGGRWRRERREGGCRDGRGHRRRRRGGRWLWTLRQDDVDLISFWHVHSLGRRRADDRSLRLIRKCLPDLAELEPRVGEGRTRLRPGLANQTGYGHGLLAGAGDDGYGRPNPHRGAPGWVGAN